MNTNTIDLEGLPARMRKARDEAGLTRERMAKLTGIPAKSIERYEAGLAEPPASRLKAFCDACDADQFEVMTGEQRMLRDDTVASSGDYTGNPPRNVPQTISEANSPVYGIKALLSDLDGLRQSKFMDASRRGAALVDELHLLMNRLEAGELMALANERGIDPAKCHDEDQLSSLFQADFDRAQHQCASIQDRIIDTAVLGIDLFDLQDDELRDVVAEMASTGLMDFWSRWDLSDSRVHRIAQLRDPLRRAAYSGRGLEL